MPPAFHNSLELKAPLKGYTLHQTVGELIVFFGIHFEMVCPPLNTPLLLYKHIHDLGLPGMFLFQSLIPCSHFSS